VSDTASDRDSSPILAASDLSVSIEGTQILSGVNIEAERGSLVGLVGPNGAGKTTALRTLSGTLTPNHGTVQITCEPIGDRSSKAISRLVATTPQETTLSFAFTVRQAVEMGRTPHLGRFERTGSEDRAAVDAAMERAEVTRFADRKVTSLSGGERQRVLIARALAQETPILLLDEPTANLDINHGINTMELVSDLVDEGKTAIAAIHDLNLAARYCDTLVVLADGSVRAAGPPADVLAPEILRDTFNAETLVTTQPVGNAPLITPLPDHDPIDRTVHVVGTGRQAAAAIGQLDAAGCTVTAGVIPSGGVAATVATERDCTAVTAPPFGNPDSTAIDRAIELAGAADAVAVVGQYADITQSVVSAADRVLTVADSQACVESPDGTLDTVAELPAAVASQSVLSGPLQ
jgi:iron complex transport system ATP-binding protein